MDRAGSFARVVSQLPGHRVIRYDRRGYGESIDAGPPATLADHVADLAAVVEERAGGPAVVIGHSLGGTVVIVLAQRRPDLVAAAGAYEAPRSWEPWWPEASAGSEAVAADDAGDAAERFMRRMVGDARWEGLADGVRSARRAEGPALLAELRSLREAPAYDEAAITVPVLLARGSEARPQHVRGMTALASALPGHPVVTVLDGADHGVHLSHPGDFATWIEQVWEVGARPLRA